MDAAAPYSGAWQHLSDELRLLDLRLGMFAGGFGNPPGGGSEMVGTLGGFGMGGLKGSPPGTGGLRIVGGGVDGRGGGVDGRGVVGAAFAARNSTKSIATPASQPTV